MAITYHAGRRIQGLSTDVNTTFEDDFSTDKWTYQGSLNYYASSGMVWNGVTNGTNTNSAVQITTASTSWVLRQKLTVNTFSSNPSSGSVRTAFGISSLNQTSDGEVNQDFLGLILVAQPSGGSSRVFQIAHADAGKATSGDTFASLTLTATTYYVEMIRNNSAGTFTVNLFSDAGYSTPVTNGSKSADISGQTITGLQYLSVKSETVGSPNGTLNGTLNDVEFYDGVIVANSGKPANVQVGSRFEETDTRKMYQYIYDWFLEGITWTFTDDLSSSTPWTSVGSGITVTGGEISMAGVAASGSNYLWRTLDGHTLSDTLWTMEFDYKSTGQSGGSVFFPFGVKSSVSPLSPNSGNSLRMRDDTDNAYLGPLSSTVGGADSGSTASIAWTEGSFYYPRIGRTNSTTMKYQLFSDAARTTQVGSTLTATISSSITGLDTLVCGGGDGGGGTSTGKISNIYISESDLFT